MSWKLKEKLRALLRQEAGTVVKPWGGKISVALIYPNEYHLGMANLGFQAVYRLINASSLAVCERAFLPDKDDLKEYRRSGTALMTLENQRYLHEFDFIAFSLSFENDYPNILTLLDLGKVPLRQAARKENHPLIFAGGITTFLNPEPIAEFMDFFALGEAEELLPAVLELAAAARQQGFQRSEFLARVGRTPGFYVPHFYSVSYHEDGTIAASVPQDGMPARVQRRWTPDVDASPAQSLIDCPAMEFGDMFLTEISRGCPYDCRFCASGWVYRPARARSFSSLRPGIEEGLSRGAKIGMVGTAVADHPEIAALCSFIRERGGTLSVSSLRANRIRPELLNALQESGHQSVTIAPETGSERLRRVVKKRMTDEEIIEAATTIVAHGIPHLRLYFLIGLPTETMEDSEAIVALTKRIQHAIMSSRKSGSIPGTITLCLSPFVPKPFTPFQWAPFESLSTIEARIKQIRNGLRKERHVQVTADLPKWSYIQALLSRGDRRVAKILMAVHEAQGNWRRALKETDLNPDFYVYRERTQHELFPWDFIDHGVSKEKLFEEYQQSLRVG